MSQDGGPSLKPIKLNKMAKADKSAASHNRPDFTVQTDKKEFEAAQKKIPALRNEIRDLEQQLVDKRKELAAASSVRVTAEAGFSNAKPAKEQLAENQATQVENAKTSTATKAGK
jgi:predicted  nucleic acid-binding Zn-ribbon protein